MAELFEVGSLVRICPDDQATYALRTYHGEYYVHSVHPLTGIAGRNAQHPAYYYLTHKATGKLLYHPDGTPFRVNGRWLKKLS